MIVRGLTFLVILFWGIAAVLILLEPAPSLGQWWFQGSPASLNLTQAIVQRYISPTLWSETFVPILQRPPWFTAVLLAMIVMLPWFVARLIRNMHQT